MAKNNDLVVTAGLNIEASVAQIKEDLKQIGDKLSANHALSITCGIDKDSINLRYWLLLDYYVLDKIHSLPLFL